MSFVLLFYSSLDSALTRQVFYTTSRLGIYKTLFNREKAKNPGSKIIILFFFPCLPFFKF